MIFSSLTCAQARPAAGIPSATNPAVVRALCDRHFGVGGDGVLAILPPVQGDARMRVINADGSEAEMCGNGIRCVAKLLYDRDPSLRRPVLRIDTGRRAAGMPDRRARRSGRDGGGRDGPAAVGPAPDPGRGAGWQAPGEKPAARR